MRKYTVGGMRSARRGRARLHWTMAMGVLLSTLTGSPALADDRPNIVFIFTDDQGYADLGVQGQVDDVKTPYLDKMAQHGVRMTAGYTTAPQCIPARAGVMAGRFQSRFDMEDNLSSPYPLDETTVAQRLQEAGYVTGMSGKWHLQIFHDQDDNRRYDPTNPHQPHNLGFDEYFSGPTRNYVANYYPDGRPTEDAPQHIQDDRFRIDLQTKWALSFLDRHAEGDQPFFLYLPYFAPHVPLTVTEEYLDRFPEHGPAERRRGLALIAAVDDGVGALFEALRDYGIEQETLIVFISDNGAPIREGAWNGSLNIPWFGDKGMLTEGGLRVPYLVYWKGVLPEGKMYEHPVTTMDFTAMAVELAGLDRPASFDGVNLIPHLSGEASEPPHEYLYWRWVGQAAIRDERWKLLKLGGDRSYLFDLASEDGESVDRAEQEPEVVERLEAELAAWMDELDPPGFEQVVHPARQRRFHDWQERYEPGWSPRPTLGGSSGE